VILCYELVFYISRANGRLT